MEHWSGLWDWTRRELIWNGKCDMKLYFGIRKLLFGIQHFRPLFHICYIHWQTFKSWVLELHSWRWGNCVVNCIFLRILKTVADIWKWCLQIAQRISNKIRVFMNYEVHFNVIWLWTWNTSYEYAVHNLKYSWRWSLTC